MFSDQPGSSGISSRNAAASARKRKLSFCRVLVFALVVLAPVLVSSPASAHVGFDRSDPAEGDAVEGPLDELTLVFTGPVQPVGEKFAVLDPADGLRLPTSIESSDGLTWVLGFEPPLSEGEVALRWTVQAEDAHAISGGMAFDVLSESADVDTAAEADDPSLPASDAGEVDTDEVVAGEMAEVPTVEEVAEGELRSTEAAGENSDGESSDGALDIGLGDSSTSGTSAVAQDFIAEGRSGLASASFVAAIGRAIGYTAAMGAIGGFIFAQLVLRRRRDLENAVVWLRRFGLLVVVGASLEVVAQVVIEVGEWSFAGLADLLASTFGLSVGLRLLGGLAWWGLPEPHLAGLNVSADEISVSRQRQLSPVVSAAATPPTDRPSTVNRGRELAETFTEYRWQSGASSSLALLGLLLLTVSHLFDGHTLSEGNRVLTSFAAAVHVIGGAVWGGGVMMLAATLWNRRRDRMPLEAMELGIRFSVLASTAAVVVGVAGMSLAWSILDSTSALWTTPWGRLLLIKLVVVALAGAMGFYNHRTLLPSAVRSRAVVGSSPAGVRLRMAVGVEAMVMITVVVVTALLVGAAS